MNGKKSLTKLYQKPRNRRRGSKVVESSVVEKEDDTDDTVI